MGQAVLSVPVTSPAGVPAKRLPHSQTRRCVIGVRRRPPPRCRSPTSSPPPAEATHVAEQRPASSLGPVRIAAS